MVGSGWLRQRGCGAEISGVARKGQARIYLWVQTIVLRNSGGQNIKERWCQQIRKRSQRGSDDGGSNDNNNKNDTHFPSTWWGSRTTYILLTLHRRSMVDDQGVGRVAIDRAHQAPTGRQPHGGIHRFARLRKKAMNGSRRQKDIRWVMSDAQDSQERSTELTEHEEKEERRKRKGSVHTSKGNYEGTRATIALQPLTCQSRLWDDCRYWHYDPVENSLEAATSLQGPMQSLSLTRWWQDGMA